MPPLRVCVLVSSYEGSDSELKEYEGDLFQNPANYFSKEDENEFTFTLVEIRKATSYRQIRQLVKSGNYDLFYNQCDGAKDEDRAGIDVVEALEEFLVPFTGATSKFYEPTKPEMKMVAYYYNINTARYAVVEQGEDVLELCKELRYPLIVKHISGYSSVGMDKSCKVLNAEQLKKRTEAFVEEYQLALVEEFITGDEATVLACRDETQPDGVRVFHPVQVNFPKGEDFKHFHLKWESFEGMEWTLVKDTDPALPQMTEMARKAFKKMMGGIGYGRIDVRIDRKTNEVFFLEINPNCGIMYPMGQEGSADWILKLSPDFKQKDFAKLQIKEALRYNDSIRLLYSVNFDNKRGYHLRAVEAIPKGKVILEDESRAVRLVTKPYAQTHFSPELYNDFVHNAWPLGADSHYYALWDREPRHWRSF
ncbi:hypothetical protein AGDE_05355, partial [Angomonas deanei]